MITSLDFDKLDEVLRVTNSQNELIYYDFTNLKQEKVPKIRINPKGDIDYKNKEWDTLTSKVSWNVIGIWPKTLKPNEVSVVAINNRK